jgi:hypothetical protein|nr:MAG TPA: hypothetical protein [Caudoviricetes sp.]
MPEKVFTMSGEFIITLTDFDVLAEDLGEAQAKFQHEVVRQIQEMYPNCNIDTSVIELQSTREDDYNE